MIFFVDKMREAFALVFYDFITKHNDIFVDKMREAFGIFEILMFEILTKR